MNMGKFEEELKRMEQILGGAKKNTLILLNESFATTTEVTAFQIAMDITHACLEGGVTETSTNRKASVEMHAALKN